MRIMVETNPNSEEGRPQNCRASASHSLGSDIHRYHRYRSVLRRRQGPKSAGLVPARPALGLVIRLRRMDGALGTDRDPNPSSLRPIRAKFWAPASGFGPFSRPLDCRSRLRCSQLYPDNCSGTESVLILGMHVGFLQNRATSAELAEVNSCELSQEAG